MPLIYSIPGFSEPVSSLSHLLAAGVFLVLGALLLVSHRGRMARMVGLGIYIFSCIFLLAMSGVFHLLEPGGDARAVLQRLDHAAIFVLIAGTFTPIHLLLFSGWKRWGMLLLIWTLAITGLTLKTIYFNDMPEWVGLMLYLGLGWMGGVSAWLMARHGLHHHLRPLVYGALAYSIGAVLDFLHFPTLIPGVLGPHELFHLFVLAGIAFHWALVVRISNEERTMDQEMASKQGVPDPE